MQEQNPYIRPSWDEYFIKITEMVGSRGTCDRGRAGCVITRDKRIVATGYVGSPTNLSHCDEVGHEMSTAIDYDGKESRHCVRTTHAEQNAICQAARFGISLDGASLYCKMTPCYVCAKMIINAGIKSVICAQDYHGGSRSKEIFAEAGIKFKLLSNNMVTYPDMAPEENNINDVDKISKISKDSENTAYEETKNLPIREEEPKDYHSLKDLINKTNFN